MHPSSGNEPAQVRSRSVVVITTGAKLCLMIAALLVIAGGYFLFVPIHLFPTEQRGTFPCGSALHPPRSQFERNVCADRNTQNRTKAISFFVAAVVVGVGGMLTFGTTRHTETEAPRPTA